MPNTLPSPTLSRLRIGAHFKVMEVESHHFLWARGQVGKLTDIRQEDFVISGIGMRLEFPDGREGVFDPSQLRMMR